MAQGRKKRAATTAGHREFAVPYDELGGPQQITEVNVRKFREHGLDIHRNEVDAIEDDHDRRERHYRVRAPRTFIDLGRRSHR